MARNERAGNCWSQPRRSTPAKNRPGCSRGLRTDDIDDLGDIVNAFTCGERGRHERESWQPGRNVPPNSGCYSSSGCCLKNGRVQCSCSWSKNTYPEQQRKSSQRYPQAFNRGALPFENKSSLWPDNNVSNGCFQDNKMLEEFILDDNELCLLNYYDIPIDVPRRRHVRNVGKVKTVSIIDTLSELASGATDREDEGGFSSAVSESAILNRLYKPRARHARQAIPRKDRTFRESCITSNIAPKILETTSTHKPVISNPIKTQSDNFHCQNFGDDGHFTCSSLKRTLKYLRKAVSSNVVEEEIRNRKHVRETKVEDDAFRLCFSDSEVKDTAEQWTSLRKEKLHFNSHAKSKSLLTVIDPFVEAASKQNSLFRSRTKASVPDWIQEVFCAAKKGDTEKMKIILKDIDPALVRNLSDDHGNNLWHICAVHNNFECLSWLCSHNQHHTEALKDENKNGFSPVSLAVKHGSLLSVQWLIHNTVSKMQLMPQKDSRPLLHVAARYGQDTIVEWLLGYMSSQDLDAGVIDPEGNTALHLASKYGHIACVKALVFQIGSLKTRNEHGLKPLDLAVKHCKTDCAEYLVALESCYNLAALNLRQHSEIQQLHKENAEMKNYFKELLTLTKRLQNRQKELVQSFSRMNMTPQYERSLEKSSRYIDDYSQLLATVMTDEEHHLLMVEDRWKKSRKQVKHTDSKKKPLDVLRSQYSHILEKVSCQSPPIPSTPETSDGSCQSEDDDVIPNEMSLQEFSAPDVVNSLSPQASVPFLNSKRKNQKVNHSRNSKDPDINPESIESLPLQNTGSLPKNVLNNRDVNLRMFFKQNPNLRQSGETCSVLEVLEPSSSDSEECSGHKKRLLKSYNSEKEAEQSSSSSALETLSPYSCRPSSSGSKASGSRSSSNGSRQNPLPQNSDNSYNPNQHSSSDKTKQSKNESENGTPEMGEKGAGDQLSSIISSEPDLIKGTQKKKIPSSTEKERKSKDFSSDTNNDNPSTSTEDSESLEADRSFSSVTDVPEAPAPVNSDPTNTGTTIKKKSFLLKFALRGRWPSKTSPRSLKNEISPEEFRETYSRTTLMDSIVPTSQIVADADSSKKSYSPSKTESENLPVESLNPEASTSNEKLSDCGLFPMTPLTDGRNETLLRSRRGLLPPRRDPPPAPPTNVREDEQSQDHSDDDMSVSIQKSSVSSCVEDCLTSSVSLHNSYMGSRSSDLWHSPDSKSLFRPASSASRVGSLTRDENFSLNKSSSASTEMLSALDSSTAGRQSPAPSEVSKTESALSPPSDVSKTESTRYLSQLGRIEESGHLTTINISNLQQKDEQNIKESALTKEIKTDVKHKKKSGKRVNSDKPWYEFSDEEDVIVPQRYQAVTVSMRSSSEDEGAITG